MSGICWEVMLRGTYYFVRENSSTGVWSRFFSIRAAVLGEQSQEQSGSVSRFVQ